MRIATANAYERSIDTLQRRQQELSSAQEQLTSGKRVARASDDPVAAARAERALAELGRVTSDRRALEASRNAIGQAESTLGDAHSLLQQARELMVAAGNPTYSDRERADLAQRLRGVRQDLLNLANRGDGAGGYLFGGQGASAPFSDTAAGVVFNGASGQRQVDASEPMPMTVDGQVAFLQAASGNGTFVTAPAAGNGPGAWIDAGKVVSPAAVTGSSYAIVFGAGSTYSILKDGNPTAVVGAPYTPGQAIAVDGLSATVSGTPAAGDRFDLTPSTATLSIFDTLQNAANELATGNRSGAQRAQTVVTALRDLDQGLNQLSSVRAGLGAVLQRTDSLDARADDRELAAKTERSNAEDLDMVEAVSAFQQRQSSYDAALKTYSMVQRLSLFQYLS